MCVGTKEIVYFNIMRKFYYVKENTNTVAQKNVNVFKKTIQKWTLFRRLLHGNLPTGNWELYLRTMNLHKFRVPKTFV